MKKNNSAFFTVTVKDMLDDKSNIDDNTNSISISIVMQIGKLEEE